MTGGSDGTVTGGSTDPGTATGTPPATPSGDRPGWSDDRPDRLLLPGLAEGDPVAVRVLLARHHPVAGLLATVTAGPAGPGDTVPTAWRGLRDRAAAGSVHAEPRAELLGLVIDLLAESELLDAEPAEPMPEPGPFLPDGDPWAGWWADDGPVAWPEGNVPAPDAVLRALRRLPLGPRVLLVLRDAAKLDPDAVAGIVGQQPEWQAVTLRQARDGFVGYLDREVRRDRS